MEVWWGLTGDQTTKRSCTKPIKSQLSNILGQSQSSTASSRHLYLSEFLSFLHSYIYDIVDVDDDGNYGFRTIATLLGWGEESWSLIRTQLNTQVHQHPKLFSSLFYDTVSEVRNALRVEHLGAHGREKWMIIPDMGYPIACRYSVVFVSLSNRLNITFFPLISTLPMYTSRHKIIDVGFVNNNHWVQVKLKSDSPLPPITDHWRQNCTKDAKAWEPTDAWRFRHWEDEVRKSK